jgi:hypothetical protein
VAALGISTLAKATAVERISNAFSIVSRPAPAWRGFINMFMASDMMADGTLIRQPLLSASSSLPLLRVKLVSLRSCLLIGTVNGSPFDTLLASVLQGATKR